MPFWPGWNPFPVNRSFTLAAKGGDRLVKKKTAPAGKKRGKSRGTQTPEVYESTLIDNVIY